MIKLKDVAEAAGVSATTVSHVINGTRRVAPGTAARVQGAIERLGYRPDSIARALKANRSHTLGMIVTSANNPFFAEVIRGVEDRCFAAGYSLVLCNADDVDAKQLAYFHTLLNKRIDGLVVMTSHNGPGFLTALQNERELPTVLMDAEHVPGWDIAVVNDDSRLGARLAIEFLLGRGFRDIAVLTGPADHARSQERLAGVEATLAEAGLTLPPHWRFATNLLADGGYQAMAQLLSQAAQRPEAVFAFNDLVALGAMRAAVDHGLHLPDDLAIIGYDNIELGAYLTPALTTIRQPIYELGATAVALLLERLTTGQPFPLSTQLSPELIVRESVGVACRR